jgi:hypothetical protein
MKRIQGELRLDGVNYYFFSESIGRIKNMIGYVKYINKTETNVDVGFIDYYPVNDFLLEKLHNDNTICYVEYAGNDIKLHEDKLILLV